MFLIHLHLMHPKLLCKRLNSQENFEAFLKFSHIFLPLRTRSLTWPSLCMCLTGSSGLRLAFGFGSSKSYMTPKV